ncbi:MAG: HPr kinase/phosphorylase [Hyphomicrobiaceae bacterium]
MAGGAETIHATCVAIGDHGVLIRGPSGAGKSDLALRLIHAPPVPGLGQSRLVCDDRVQLIVKDGMLWAGTAPNLAGKLEIRGVGIVSVDHVASAPVRLVVEACGTADMPRMPEPDIGVPLLGREVPAVSLPLCEASAVAKVFMALRTAIA